jgi:hypothetical protein
MATPPSTSRLAASTACSNETLRNLLQREKATQLQNYFLISQLKVSVLPSALDTSFHIFNFTELEILTEVDGDVQLASTNQQDGISPSTSGKSSQAENTTQAITSWGHTLEGSANGTIHPPIIQQPSKTPSTSKLSWAQIARYVSCSTHSIFALMPCSSQEKPTTVAPLATQLIPPPVQAAVPESGLETELEDVGREEPTTEAGPTWDDSLQAVSRRT